MEFDVYCDESKPDLFTSKKPDAQYLMIGSLWLPSSLREIIKDEIKSLRKKHNKWGEIKWTKISYKSLDFYEALIELYLSYNTDIRFRCIAIDHKDVNWSLHNDDKELGFYKFYYQLLHHWILDFNIYSIFCDTKTNRDPHRLEILQRCLGNSNLSSKIIKIQSIPSGQMVLIQLCDLLLGCAQSRLNNSIKVGTAKEKIVKTLEQGLNTRQLEPTRRNENHFNIFRIKLDGGW